MLALTFQSDQFSALISPEMRGAITRIHLKVLPAFDALRSCRLMKER